MTIKFLLLAGPSGAGKTTIIHRLQKLDGRFVYISPYITRKLRPNEKDKVHVSDAQLRRLKKSGKILLVNRTYATLHATPKEKITEAFKLGKFPVLDFPVQRVWKIKRIFPNRLFVVYVEPPSLDVLKRRISKKNHIEKRLRVAKAELKELKRGKFDRLIDLRVISREGEDGKVTRIILKKYLGSIR